MGAIGRTHAVRAARSTSPTVDRARERRVERRMNVHAMTTTRVAALRYDAHPYVESADASVKEYAELANEPDAVAFATTRNGGKTLCERSGGPAYASCADVAASGGVDFNDGARALHVGRDVMRGNRAVFIVCLDDDDDGVRAAFEKAAGGSELALRDTKEASYAFDMADAAIVARGAALSAWREKQKFCRQCGTPAPKIVGAGRKVVCGNCRASEYPDLMPCCLALITCGNYILLGRNKRWPQNFYSLIAGFVERSESLEACVAREALEEAMIAVDPKSIEYVRCQPWPFPNQLMIGFRASAAPERLGPLKMPPQPQTHDGELADARWFHVDYLASRLAPDRAFADPRGAEGENEIPFGEIALPGEHALARVLVQDWVEEKMSYRRRRCDDRLVTTVVEGSFFTECALSSGDDEDDDNDSSVFEKAESLHFVMAEVLLAQEGQAPVVLRAAPGDLSKVHQDVVAEIERVGQGARAVAFVRATGRILCARDDDGTQRINVKMLSETSDEGFDARKIVVAMMQKACPFHDFAFVEV